MTRRRAVRCGWVTTVAGATACALAAPGLGLLALVALGVVAVVVQAVGA